MFEFITCLKAMQYSITITLEEPHLAEAKVIILATDEKKRKKSLYEMRPIFC